jgi:hypothetical protein
MGAPLPQFEEPCAQQNSRHRLRGDSWQTFAQSLGCVYLDVHALFQR